MASWPLPDIIHRGDSPLSTQTTSLGFKMSHATIGRRYLLTDAEVAQILYCLESMQSDYSDGTPDAADFDAAMAAIQSPLPPGS